MKLETLLKEVNVGETTVFDVSGGAEARKLTIEVRKNLPEEPRAPKRQESPARKHLFLSAESLATYLSHYGGEATVLYADPENGRISAVLDETAEGGREIVVMEPQIHPLWAPWAGIAGQVHALDEFVAFVLKHRRSVVEPDGKELALTLSQIRAKVEVEIRQGRGKSAVNGLLVTTQIQGQRQQDVVELPEEIRLRVPIYVQTEPQEIELDLCLEASASGAISVLVTAGTVEEAKVRAFEQMVEKVREGAPGCLFTFGRPQHTPWAYLA